MYRYHRITALLTCVTGALGAAACSIDRAAAQPDSAARDCPATTPAELVPPIDQTLAFAADAQGVQRYQCAPSNTGPAWTLIAPDADLFTTTAPVQEVIHHFAGPTWLYKDSSSVVGARTAGVTVDATAIPWLLLNVTSHGGAPGKLSDIKSIQRLKTTGGNAPATGCDAEHFGVETDVLYTARYFFYRTSTKPGRTVRCGA